eukprot:193099-Pyramimonas_sp.AAC.1
MASTVICEHFWNQLFQLFQLQDVGLTRLPEQGAKEDAYELQARVGALARSEADRAEPSGLASVAGQRTR